jgi:hypothetical protein
MEGTWLLWVVSDVKHLSVDGQLPVVGRDGHRFSVYTWPRAGTAVCARLHSQLDGQGAIHIKAAARLVSAYAAISVPEIGVATVVQVRRTSTPSRGSGVYLSEVPARRRPLPRVRLVRSLE